MDMGNAAEWVASGTAVVVCLASALSASRSKKDAKRASDRADEMARSAKRLADAAEAQATTSQGAAASAAHHALTAEELAAQTKRLADATEAAVSGGDGVPAWQVECTLISGPYRAYVLRNKGRRRADGIEFVKGAGAWGEEPRKGSPVEPTTIPIGGSEPFYIYPYEGNWSPSVGIISLGCAPVTITLPTEQGHRSAIVSAVPLP